jgi:hypothetical protein
MKQYLNIYLISVLFQGMPTYSVLILISAAPKHICLSLVLGMTKIN